MSGVWLECAACGDPVPVDAAVMAVAAEGEVATHERCAADRRADVAAAALASWPGMGTCKAFGDR